MKDFFIRFAVYVIVSNNNKNTFVMIDLLGQKPQFHSSTAPTGVNYRSEQKTQLGHLTDRLKNHYNLDHIPISFNLRIITHERANLAKVRIANYYNHFHLKNILKFQ